ncbi:ABC transporter permease [Microbacterium capsulatum]|uniref:ABC transporter permease n=1 Tax=Microbacterium capsulatum TaxID=3041921 RepID=A0ABU0XIM7_9MICO|nr:ABC transporter permease [Microbacterium sp. ASV81]MDQ4214519.1 ABC transporter permease [Microbacterium sp. ASV81]
MSTSLTSAPALGEPTVVKVRSLKTPITLLAIVALLGLLFLLAPRSGTAVYRLAESGAAIALGDVSVPAGPVIWTTWILALVLGVWSLIAAQTYRRIGLWLPIVYAVLAMTAFLTWAGAGAAGAITLTGLLGGSISLAVPLVFGALAGVIGERAGVVNVAIEGQFLLGAFTAAILGSITHNPFVGLIGAMLGGVLISLVLGAFAIRYLVDQVIVGVVLDVFASGLTGFLYQGLLAPNGQTLNSPVRFSLIKIPILGDIPVIGPALFNQTFLVYLMYVVVAIVAWAMYRTRWGLRVRAVGEHPHAADTVGIKVNPTRFWNLQLAGAIAGIGGAYFTLVSVPQFTKDMTAGLGYIALAAVIFGRWDPLRAALAALLFGFATNLQNLLSVLKTPIPGEFMLMLPYLVTILAVVGFVGQIKAPAADGKPYIKS